LAPAFGLSPQLFSFALFYSRRLSVFVCQVSPTHGTDERISIAFNINGNWEDTTNIRNSFAVELAPNKPTGTGGTR
jgi:hypothetical protein